MRGHSARPGHRPLTAAPCPRPPAALVWFVVLLAASLYPATVSALATAATAKPHIIFCLVDDLGWNTVYNNDAVISPTINGLAAKGVKLTSFYTYRYCSPTRASFLTGRLPFKLLNIRENLHTMASPDATDVRFTMLPKRLAEAGYWSIQIGKWYALFLSSLQR